MHRMRCNMTRPLLYDLYSGAGGSAKGLAKRGLEAHGMKALWLCGTMFGLSFYRHRLFETNFHWGWERPRHMKHRGVVLPRRNIGDRAHIVMAKGSLAAWQRGNGAQAAGVGGGHAKGG